MNVFRTVLHEVIFHEVADEKNRNIDVLCEEDGDVACRHRTVGIK